MARTRTGIQADEHRNWRVENLNREAALAFANGNTDIAWARWGEALHDGCQEARDEINSKIRPIIFAGVCTILKLHTDVQKDCEADERISQVSAELDKQLGTYQGRVPFGNFVDSLCCKLEQQFNGGKPVGTTLDFAKLGEFLRSQGAGGHQSRL
jgi:hypothetical protein